MERESAWRDFKAWYPDYATAQLKEPSKLSPFNFLHQDQDYDFQHQPGNTLLAKGSKGHYAESGDSFDGYHPRSQVFRPLKLRGEEGENLARNAVSTETGHYLICTEQYIVFSRFMYQKNYLFINFKTQLLQFNLEIG